MTDHDVASPSSPALLLGIDVSVVAPCTQCGVVSYPHYICRCRLCGKRHLKSRACEPYVRLRTSATEESHVQDTAAVQCHQCGLLSLPHKRCRCTKCSRIHLLSSRCRTARQSKAHKAKAAMNGSQPEVQNVGSMDRVCSFCRSRFWHSETISCCTSGDIVLPACPEVPQVLSDLILSPHVRENIRVYNMAMAMASVGHKNISLPDGMFVLGGKTYHRVGSLFPADGDQHAFAQIYVLDTEQASDRRLEVLGGRDDSSPLRRDVLSQLHRLMLQYNPCVQQFVTAARDNLPQLVWRCSDDISTMQMGALVVQPGSRRDIVIQQHVSSCARI